MKYAYLLLVLIVLSVATTQGSVRFNRGDKVNVWVLKGIKLYKSPDSKSTITSTIPYGVSVEVLSTGTDSLKAWQGKITNDITPVPVTLKGYWLKVKYGQIEGYVFDGYLSKMPCLKLNENGSPEEVDTYIKRNYKGYTKRMIKKVVQGVDSEETTYYYKGAIILEESSGDGCWDTNVYFKGISYQDVQLFEKVCLNGADAAQDIKIKRLKNNIVKFSFASCT
ncbi:SH3 domain-containing protein [Mucilaginibacter galii]|uniref:SH3b domain-containing protein n=1 Tax=Mucilaginibacter galii TaxID=2005073 RepID=A0A917J721_9SPHI|nr:SH3 domain-containing protein [Mucilaginibacter galii]GGI49065.1 hypothetical protein GCM10011425_02770 [Mucilaginibacter galii]